MLPCVHVGASVSRRFLIKLGPPDRREAADTTVAAHTSARAATTKAVVFMVGVEGGGGLVCGTCRFGFVAAEFWRC